MKNNGNRFLINPIFQHIKIYNLSGLNLKQKNSKTLATCHHPLNLHPHLTFH